MLVRFNGMAIDCPTHSDTSLCYDEQTLQSNIGKCSIRGSFELEHQGLHGARGAGALCESWSIMDYIEHGELVFSESWSIADYMEHGELVFSESWSIADYTEHGGLVFSESWSIADYMEHGELVFSESWSIADYTEHGELVFSELEHRRLHGARGAGVL
ncbi:UNVERIFIED_CONTAM: hypothetical protein FKN15_037921 [Acipenser sinensis]